MNAKTKLEAIPTPAQLLRDAIAHRDALAQEIETITKRYQMFAPIEAEVAAAEGDLQRVLQIDATAMKAWADAGAKGDAPNIDHDAREAGARKLTHARAKLEATGVAKRQIEADHAAAHERYRHAQSLLRAAEIEVLAQEFIRSGHAMKQAANAYLATELHHFAVKQMMFNLDGGRAGAVEESLRPFTRPMNIEEERQFNQQVMPDIEHHLAALLRGEELNPDTLPRVAA